MEQLSNEESKINRLIDMVLAAPAGKKYHSYFQPPERYAEERPQYPSHDHHNSKGFCCDGRYSNSRSFSPGYESNKKSKISGFFLRPSTFSDDSELQRIYQKIAPSLSYIVKVKAIVKKPGKFNFLAAKQFADDEAQEDWFEAKRKQPRYPKLMLLNQLEPVMMRNTIFSPDDQPMISYKIQNAFQNAGDIYGHQHNHKKYFKNYNSLRKTSLHHKNKKTKPSDFHI